MEFRVNGDAAAAAQPLDDAQKDMVIRGLRRRLWRAFQEDNAELALRCYQATFDDFEQMLREEEEGKDRGDSDDGSRSPRSRSPKTVSPILYCVWILLLYVIRFANQCEQPLDAKEIPGHKGQ